MDFGQNFVGWALLTLPEMPAGVTVKFAPAESLNANGTTSSLLWARALVEQTSFAPTRLQVV